MNILGIIPAKSKSYRFPGKNARFFHDVADKMLKSSVEDVIVASDDTAILEASYKMGCKTFIRNEKEVDMNLPVIDLLKHVYLSLDTEYTHILCIFGCCINVTVDAIQAIIEMAHRDKDAQEVRSFTKNGYENGMFLLTKERLMEGHISSYLAAVHNNLVEIHEPGQLTE
jgi:CMP-2-keto-3-deoxyoctulosonic acid synthetase